MRDLMKEGGMQGRMKGELERCGIWAAEGEEGRRDWMEERDRMGRKGHGT